MAFLVGTSAAVPMKDYLAQIEKLRRMALVFIGESIIFAFDKVRFASTACERSGS